MQRVYIQVLGTRTRDFHRVVTHKTSVSDFYDASLFVLRIIEPLQHVYL